MTTTRRTLLSMLLAACSSPAPTPMDGGTHPDGAPPPHDAYFHASDPAAVSLIAGIECGMAARNVCQQSFACGCVQPSLPPTDVAACVVNISDACQATPAFDDWTVVQTDGVHLIDDSMASACRATIAEREAACLTSGAEWRTFHACIHMLRSAVPIGAACVGPGLCAGGNGYCDPDAHHCHTIPNSIGTPCLDVCGGSLACVGSMCAEAVPAGGGCSDDEDCAPPHSCIGGRCGTLALEGAACTGDQECRVGLGCRNNLCATRDPIDCRLDGPICPDNTYCNQVAPLCRAIGGVGADCDGPTSCLPGTFCHPLLLICQTQPTLGQACFGSCADGLICMRPAGGGSQQCVALPARGEACVSACAGTDLCTDGVCVARPALGERCASLCTDGFTCDFDSMRCVAQPGLDEPCYGASRTTLLQCAGGFWCDDNGTAATCRKVRDPGEDCPLTVECASNLVCQRTTLTCTIPPMIGEKCWDNACQPGAYCERLFGAGYCDPVSCPPTP